MTYITEFVRGKILSIYYTYSKFGDQKNIDFGVEGEEGAIDFETFFGRHIWMTPYEVKGLRWDLLSLCGTCGSDGLDADGLPLAPGGALALARLGLLVLLVRGVAVLDRLHSRLPRLRRLKEDIYRVVHQVVHIILLT